jgi:heme-degrading monooxygenase HmoA
MIARIWRGATRARDAKEYTKYLQTTGIADYRATAGNEGVLLLTHSEGETEEFLIVSFWKDFDAIRRFAGPDPERAVYYPEDERFLLGKEPRVTHYEVEAGGIPAGISEPAPATPGS